MNVKKSKRASSLRRKFHFGPKQRRWKRRKGGGARAEKPWKRKGGVAVFAPKKPKPRPDPAKRKVLAGPVVQKWEAELRVPIGEFV